MTEGMRPAARDGGEGAFTLSGKVALVTGSTGGIGLAIAEAFAAAGAAVVLNGRGEARLRAVSAAVPGSTTEAFDVADVPAALAAIDRIVERSGRLDILVCNAAHRDRRPFADITPADFRRMLEANMVSPYAMAQHAARHMRGGGTILFVTSMAGPQAVAGDPAYAASKGGLAALARALAVELGPSITVNGIAPGPVLTEANQGLSTGEFAAAVRRQIPLGRFASPLARAGAAVFLASRAASYVNGHILQVDGGGSIKLFG